MIKKKYNNHTFLDQFDSSVVNIMIVMCGGGW